MLIGEGNRVPDSRCLIDILLFVWLEQLDVAAHLLIRRVDIAEDPSPGGFRQLAAAVDVDQRPLLLALIAVEDPQRYVEAEAEGIVVRHYVVKRRIVCPPYAVGGVGRTVGYRQLVICFRLLDRLNRRLKVGT